MLDSSLKVYAMYYISPLELYLFRYCGHTGDMCMPVADRSVAHARYGDTGTGTGGQRLVLLLRDDMTILMSKSATNYSVHH